MLRAPPRRDGNSATTLSWWTSSEPSISTIFILWIAARYYHWTTIRSFDTPGFNMMSPATPPFVFPVVSENTTRTSFSICGKNFTDPLVSTLLDPETSVVSPPTPSRETPPIMFTSTNELPTSWSCTLPPVEYWSLPLLSSGLINRDPASPLFPNDPTSTVCSRIPAVGRACP